MRSRPSPGAPGRAPGGAGDPVSVLERWREHGAPFRVLQLSRDAAIVELCTCAGEPVERLESSDPRLLDYLRAVERDAG